MKRSLFALLLMTAGCISHTTEENYTMANKVVGELTTIKDSIDIVHAALSTTLPGSEEHLVKEKSTVRYQETYISFISKNDSASGKLMTRYNVLFEHYNMYQELFKRVYKQLPHDSAAKNETIRKEFEAAIQ